MDDKRVKEIEAKIAELEARWPAHSAPPNLWTEMEQLENELEEARGANAGGGPSARQEQAPTD